MGLISFLTATSRRQKGARFVLRVTFGLGAIVAATFIGIASALPSFFHPTGILAAVISVTSFLILWRIRKQHSTCPEFLNEIFAKTYEAGSVKFAPMTTTTANGCMRVVIFCENRTDAAAEGSFHLSPTQGFLGGRPEDLARMEIGFHLLPGELQAVGLNYPVHWERQGERISFDAAAIVSRRKTGRLLRLTDGEPLGAPASYSLGSELGHAAATIASAALPGLGPQTKVRITFDMPSSVAERCQPDMRQTTLWLPGDVPRLNFDVDAL